MKRCQPPAPLRQYRRSPFSDQHDRRDVRISSASILRCPTRRGESANREFQFRFAGAGGLARSECDSVTQLKRIAFCIAAFVAIHAQAAEVIPPKPAAYFNDYAGVVSKEAALRFNEQLAQFERDTSNQVVVAVFPKMQSETDVAAYTQLVAQSWAVGQKDKRNGVVLFVFTQDRKIFIQVGYG